MWAFPPQICLFFHYFLLNLVVFDGFFVHLTRCFTASQIQLECLTVQETGRNEASPFLEEHCEPYGGGELWKWACVRGQLKAEHLSAAVINGICAEVKGSVNESNGHFSMQLQNKTDERINWGNAEKNKVTCFCFLVVFTLFSFPYFFFNISFLVFPFTLGGGRKILEKDKNETYSHAVLFRVCGFCRSDVWSSLQLNVQYSSFTKYQE